MTRRFGVYHYLICPPSILDDPIDLAQTVQMAVDGVHRAWVEHPDSLGRMADKVITGKWSTAWSIGGEVVTDTVIVWAVLREVEDPPRPEFVMTDLGGTT